MSTLENQVSEACAFLSSRWPHRPKFGIILGTGAGIIGKEISADLSIPYGDIPNFPVSTSIGHQGKLICGSLGGIPVLAMQGRFHLYEGYPVDLATLPIHVMQAMGVELLFVSNASGGINPKFASGEIMLIESHVDFMYKTSTNMTASVVEGRPVIRSDQFYSPHLIEQAKAFSRQDDFLLHQGVYGAMLGPNYETRAEYRFLRKIGADVAGMSTVPEVTVAARYGMQVLAMSIISNVAKPDVLDATSGQEVIDAAEVAAPRLKSLVVNAMEQYGK